jgi:CRISPR-associated protein Csb1
MPKLDLSKNNWQTEALKPEGSTSLVIRAWLEPVAGMNRFQPSGFPEIGHVIYDAPREDSRAEKICIVDSSASMANHLEAVCMDGPTELHKDLVGLPYVKCVTDKAENPDKDDPLDTLVCITLSEGHRLASDYFLDASLNPVWQDARKEPVTPRKDKAETGKETAAQPPQEKTIPAQWAGIRFREQLRQEFGIKEVKKDKTYFIWPATWWTIYKTLFKYDPNSLVHGVMFAKEQIKLSRMLTPHMEAFGAARVGSSGVKFDRLGKTTSGQPIFAVDEETARTIVATFILDLGLLRSYGRGNDGLNDKQKRLLLDLAVWKIKSLLQSPFRFRTGCQLLCSGIAWWDDTDGPNTPSDPSKKPGDLSLDIKASISACGFDGNAVKVYYPASELFKTAEDNEPPAPEAAEAADSEENEGEEA